MTKQDIEKELNGLSWNELRTYCKDSDIKIHGLDKEKIIKLAVEKRMADIESIDASLKSETSNDSDKESSSIEKMTLLKKVTVQNLNPAEMKLPSKIITVGNMKDGFVIPSYVVQFNTKQLLPQGIIRFLKSQTFRTSKNVKNQQGEHNTINIMKNHYNVIIHP